MLRRRFRISVSFVSSCDGKRPELLSGSNAVPMFALAESSMGVNPGPEPPSELLVFRNGMVSLLCKARSN